MEERRRSAAELLRSGKLCDAEIARSIGVSRTSVLRWRRALEAGGLRALRRKPTPGRPGRLKREEIRLLLRTLKQGAMKSGFPTERWTLKRIATVIKRKFAVSYHPLYLSRFLKSYNWSHQYPKPYAAERNESLIRAWLEKDWPRIKKSAAEARRHSIS